MRICGESKPRTLGNRSNLSEGKGQQWESGGFYIRYRRTLSMANPNKVQRHAGLALAKPAMPHTNEGRHGRWIWGKGRVEIGSWEG